MKEYDIVLDKREIENWKKMKDGGEWEVYNNLSSGLILGIRRSVEKRLYKSETWTNAAASFGIYGIIIT